MRKRGRRLKIVVAPDSFKGSLTAAQACAAIAAGAERALSGAEIISVPMADGGEGTVEALVDGLGGRIVECEVEGPLGRPVRARYGITRGTTSCTAHGVACGTTDGADHSVACCTTDGTAYGVAHGATASAADGAARGTAHGTAHGTTCSTTHGIAYDTADGAAHGVACGTTGGAAHSAADGAAHDTTYGTALGTAHYATNDAACGTTHDETYGIATAVIEMAQASGLPLLEEGERDPLAASTFGTGQLILDALEQGARDFIIGIGGSATNDGGAGMAQALGFRLLDTEGAELPRGGAALLRLGRIDPSGADPRIKTSRFTVACDVDNPLLGPRGASAVFGPQKGATPEDVELLDRALSKLACQMKEDLGVDVSNVPGAGAAGGLGAGSIAFLGAELKRGVDIVIGAAGLAEKMKGAALVITGEGRTDSQTLSGKTVHGVTLLAKSLGVPAVVISGSLGPGAGELLENGAERLYALMEGGVTLEEAMKNSAALLEERAKKAVSEFVIESAFQL